MPTGLALDSPLCTGITNANSTCQAPHRQAQGMLKLEYNLLLARNLGSWNLLFFVSGSFCKLVKTLCSGTLLLDLILSPWWAFYLEKLHWSSWQRCTISWINFEHFCWFSSFWSFFWSGLPSCSCRRPPRLEMLKNWLMFKICISSMGLLKTDSYCCLSFSAFSNESMIIIPSCSGKGQIWFGLLDFS